MLKRILTPLASLSLTVILLALSMLLVYAGTWAQIDFGIWEIQKNYFHSVFTWVPFRIFFPRDWTVYGGFPMPGGYTLGLLLLVNLLAAHTVRFKATPKRVGVILIHLGLILLLVGEGIRSRATESQMAIEEGSWSNYSQDIHEIELAVIDKSPHDRDDVTVVRADKLAEGSVVQDPKLPFDMKVDEYFVNSDVVMPEPDADPNLLLQFNDRALKVVERKTFTGTNDAEKVNTPSAIVTLSKDGKTLGKYVVSTFTAKPKTVEVGGKTYHVELRFRRYYKPFQIHLIDFRFERYPGTAVPKDYTSIVRLVDPTRNEDREVRIWMNHPLRHGGETFYQASFDDKTEKTTVLQVVRNPGWVMPYVACVIGGLGLLIHFGIMLVTFIRRRTAAIADKAELAAKAPPPAPVRVVKGKKGESYVLPPAPQWSRGALLFPLAILGLCLVYVIAHALPPRESKSFDVQSFGRLPILFDGRTQPLDSLARNTLKVISNREYMRLEKDEARALGFDKKTVPAIRWLLDTMARPETAEKYPVFRIDHPELKGLLGATPEQKMFTWRELTPTFRKLAEQVRQVPENSKERDQYQQAVMDLWNKLGLYDRLGPEKLGVLFLTPPQSPGEEWQQLGAAYQRDPDNPHPAAKAFVEALMAYGNENAIEFNTKLAAYHRLLERTEPRTMDKTSFEAWFNRFDPSMLSMVFYVMVFVLAALSWLGWSVPLWRAAFWVLVLSMAIHTFALIARVYISGRPPVTNLASSAIFIGWGAVILAAAAEWLYRNGIGAVAGSAVGFVTLIIYQQLALEGDTMKVLQAVLDTNIWLATHVVAITLGYSATFLAGILAIIYVIRGVFTKAPLTEVGAAAVNASASKASWQLDGVRVSSAFQVDLKTLSRMIYGVTCFAILFSFIGTVLGGIWADQSWGRFWGWDPKENGAVLIVLANAIVLHARWGGLVKDRGVAILAIFGNIVTAWSWFGTNMLGVGLHSYGFMDSALHWLLAFVFTQLALIGIANIPLEKWKSFRDQGPSRTAQARRGTAAAPTA